MLQLHMTYASLDSDWFMIYIKVTFWMISWSNQMEVVNNLPFTLRADFYSFALVITVLTSDSK